MAVPKLVSRMEQKGLRLLVEGNDQLLFASDRSGLDPLQDVAFLRPHLLDGADVALPAVGLSAAYLLIYGKVGRVFARAMTSAARSAFREEGIDHEAHAVAKKLPAKLSEGLEEYEALSKEAVTPLAFVEILKRRRS